MSSEDRILTRKEAADMLGIKSGTLAQWHCTGEKTLPYIKFGYKVMYKYDDLKSFMKAAQVKN